MIRITTYLGNLGFKTRVFLVCLIAVLNALIIVFIVRQGHFFPSGVLGIVLALEILIPKTWVFPLFMTFLNIPLILFAYFKVSKKFAILTLLYTIVNTSIYTILSNIIPFSFSLFKTSLILSNTGTRVIASVIAGVIYGIVLSFVYMLKGSAGGIDNLSIYYSIRKKSYGIYNMILSISLMLIIVFIADFLREGINNNNWNFYNIFNNTFFITILFITITSITTHYAYPRYIKVAVKVFTTKGYKISRSLVQRNYPHKHTITMVRSPISNKMRAEIYIVVYYHQYVDLLRRINNIDNKAFVTVTKLTQVRGYLAPPKLN